MTSASELINSVQGEQTVISAVFFKRDAEEDLGIKITEEQWQAYAEWFAQQGWAGEVGNLFSTYLDDAIHGRSR